jgi:hypothetical protein
VHPTGVKIPANHYHSLMSQIDFELGQLHITASRSIKRRLGKNYYNGYRPLEMMLQTDVFFNFIEAHFDIFKEQNGTTLKQAYACTRSSATTPESSECCLSTRSAKSFEELLRRVQGSC